VQLEGETRRVHIHFIQGKVETEPDDGPAATPHKPDPTDFGITEESIAAHLGLMAHRQRMRDALSHAIEAFELNEDVDVMVVGGREERERLLDHLTKAALKQRFPERVDLGAEADALAAMRSWLGLPVTASTSETLDAARAEHIELERMRGEHPRLDNIGDPAIRAQLGVVPGFVELENIITDRLDTVLDDESLIPEPGAPNKPYRVAARSVLHLLTDLRVLRKLGEN
jgi:hypothetical protein